MSALAVESAPEGRLATSQASQLRFAHDGIWPAAERVGQVWVMDLPDTIAIFPLPNVVLFPQVDLPLHIFEPRYRSMVSDALDADRRIGMVLLRPDWQRDYYGSPAVYPVGCSGRIQTFELLEDGRSNLSLRGERRFEILEEIEGKPYRRARVRWSAPDAAASGGPTREKLRACVVALLERAGKPGADEVWTSLPGRWETLVNLLAFGLPLQEVEKMALLECEDCDTRATRMIEILEFRLAEHGVRGTTGGRGRASWH